MSDEVLGSCSCWGWGWESWTPTNFPFHCPLQPGLGAGSAWDRLEAEVVPCHGLMLLLVIIPGEMFLQLIPEQVLVFG